MFSCKLRLNEARSVNWLCCIYTCLVVGSHRIIECLLPHMRPTRTCTEAYEKYFRSYVVEKQFRNACRWIKNAWNIITMFHQSCPRVTFLGPDPTRRNVDPTRPATADKKSDQTRPAARPFPICTFFNRIIIYLLFNYYILNIVENLSIRM